MKEVEVGAFWEGIVKEVDGGVCFGVGLHGDSLIEIYDTCKPNALSMEWCPARLLILPLSWVARNTGHKFHEMKKDGGIST